MEHLTYKIVSKCSVELKRKPTSDELIKINLCRFDELPIDLIDLEQIDTEFEDFINGSSNVIHFEDAELKECPKCGETKHTDVPSWGQKICKNCCHIYK